MRVSSLLSVCILSVLTAAQDPSFTDIIGSLPFCALGPLTFVTADINCSIDDVPCLCNDKSLISSLTNKLESACSAEDMKSVVQLAVEKCADSGVNVTIPVKNETDSGNNSDNDTNWGERTRVTNLGMMLGVVGLVGLVAL